MASRNDSEWLYRLRPARDNFASDESRNLHTGTGPPGISYDPCCRGFRVSLGNPALVEEIESAAFLKSEEKRDILYNNAVRFFRLEGAKETATKSREP